TDPDPVKRTIAATLLSRCNTRHTIESLCSALVIETKLYPKLALCDSLASFGKTAVDHLIPLLGKIGENQHLTPSASVFGKKSYPLPRDIAARILIRIGSDAIPALSRLMLQGEQAAVREGIDALGFICFYAPNENMLIDLIKCYNRFQKDDVIRWKIAIALRSFHSLEAERMAEHFISEETISIIREEAAQSMKLNKSGKQNN
ncbi:MAG TPA: hypothetical protein VF857_10410, partial [Spirochaetota bacterium]